MVQITSPIMPNPHKDTYWSSFLNEDITDGRGFQIKELSIQDADLVVVVWYCFTTHDQPSTFQSSDSLFYTLIILSPTYANR